MYVLLLTLIFTQRYTDLCETHRPCYLPETETVVMRGEAASHPLVIPEGVHFPHFQRVYNNRDSWMKCGEQIADASGLSLDVNQLVTLCHEVKHHVYGPSHNQ
jgi:hypothetical protein